MPMDGSKINRVCRFAISSGSACPAAPDLLRIPLRRGMPRRQLGGHRVCRWYRRADARSPVAPRQGLRGLWYHARRRAMGGRSATRAARLLSSGPGMERRRRRQKASACLHRSGCRAPLRRQFRRANVPPDWPGHLRGATAYQRNQPNPRRRASGPRRSQYPLQRAGVSPARNRDAQSAAHPLSILRWMVRAAGLEPARACAPEILSLMRLPFRHARTRSVVGAEDAGGKIRALLPAAQ